jgi:spermidine synthase
LNKWYRERDAANVHRLIRIKENLYRGRSKYQEMRVFDSYQFGRILTLDNLIMLSELDEAHYHEMLIHVPLFTHPKPQEVLVIGGGDGGSVREILRHPSVRKVDLVEIDAKVVELSKKFLPKLSKGLSNPKVNIRIEDGIKFISNKDNAYDAILIDSTDPIGPAVGLFQISFYKSCLRALRDDGVFAAQVGSPVYAPKIVRRILRRLKRVFPIAKPYMAHIPTYCEGYYCLAFCSKKFDPIKHFQKKRYDKLRLKLKYHNPEVHRGAFMLPTYIKQLLAK